VVKGIPFSKPNDHICGEIGDWSIVYEINGLVTNTKASSSYLEQEEDAKKIHSIDF
jgi:hypothetical protein